MRGTTGTGVNDMTSARPGQGGFSLTELMIAMLVTMLISGAVFGLLTAGQGAFRREPELTDRQQNIRVAMDLIQRDVATAGVGLGPFTQVFTPGLDGIGPIALGPSGNAVDQLQILGSDGECADVPGLSADDGTDQRVTAAVNIPACFPADGLAVVTFPGPVSRWGMTHGVVPVTTATLDFVAPQPPGSQIGPAPATQTLGTIAPITVTRAQLVRYAIANDTDGVPSLFRSATGGLDPLTAAVVPPGPTPAAQAAGWLMVARGIEDLQVLYVQAGNPPPAGIPTPLVIAPPAGWNTLVQSVQVTLWARALGINLQGQRSDGGMPPAVRGSLVTTTSPRPTLLWLRGAPPPFTWQ
jgi:type IV pilus assembly protein PilW